MGAKREKEITMEWFSSNWVLMDEKEKKSSDIAVPSTDVPAR